MWKCGNEFKVNTKKLKYQLLYFVASSLRRNHFICLSLGNEGKFEETQCVADGNEDCIEASNQENPLIQ